MVTHTVVNQPKALADYNLFDGNAAIRSALAFNAPSFDTAPLLDLWEGAGNIMAIDLLRALRNSDAAAALVHECAPARGAHPALDRLLERLPARVDVMANETEARTLTQDIALALQASLRVQSAPAVVYSAFCDSRLGGNWGHVFGTLGTGVDIDAIVERDRPM